MTSPRSPQTPRAATKPTPPRQTAWVIFAAVVVVALGLAAWHFVPLLSPLGAAQGYCSDLTQQHYQQMYQQRLSATLRVQVSEQAFTGAEQLADQQAGRVMQCDTSLFATALDGNTAVAHVTERRASGITVATDLHLSGQNWQIVALPDPAIMPFAVAQQFCDALSGQLYDQAYHLLATAITASLTQDRYTALQQFADQTNGTVTTCTISQLALTTNTATATVQVQRQHGPTGGMRVQIQLSPQAGTWLITNLPTA